MAKLQLKGIVKRFGDSVVLKGIDLDIAHGEFVSLVGPSGCGKSTLLRIISGLEHQSEGSILLDGRPVDALRPRERDLAMVFQSYALYPHLTVAQNVAVPLVMRQMNFLQRLPLVGGLVPGVRQRRHRIDATVGQVCEALSIDALKDRRPKDLSGGQRQRVALARAMVREPSGFLMDEPLSNLDAKMRLQARTEIAELHRSLAATFVYVTHDQAEAMTMSDRIAIMMEGELLQVGSPDDIYNDPVDLRVAEFIGSPRINVLRGRLDGRGCFVRTLGAGQPDKHEVVMAFRPERSRLSEAGEGRFAGTVRHVENLGSDLFVHVDVKDASTLITRLDPFAGRPRLGEAVSISVPEDAMLFFSADRRRLRPVPGMDVAA